MPLVAPTLLLSQLVDAAGVFGGATAITAIAFVAYLVGLVVLGLPVFVDEGDPASAVSTTSEAGLEQLIVRDLRDARRRGVPFQRLIGQFEILAANEEARMSDEAREELSAEAAFDDPEHRTPWEISQHDQWTWLEEDWNVKFLASTVLQELDLAELSLQTTSRDVYDRYDRVRAEGEFRLAVALPIGALAVALAARLSVEYHNLLPLTFLLLLIPAWALWNSGRARLVHAKDVMVQAILSGQASSPTLKLITDLEGTSPTSGGR
ncbi:hypothetical protein [Agromyces sp. NPDC055658]